MKGWGKSKPPTGAVLDRGHPLTENLSLCYLFNEGAGAVVKNLALPALYDGTILKVNNSTNTFWYPTPLGIGLGHDTTSTANGITFTAITSGTTWSWECYFKLTTTANGNYGNMFTASSSTGFWAVGSSTTNFNVSLYFSGDHKNTTSLSVGTWYHVVCAVNAGSAQFYINGVADGTVASVPSIAFNGMLCDNGGSNNEQLTGVVAYERFWVNRVLTQSDARRLYLYPFEMVSRPQLGVGIVGSSSLGGGGTILHYYTPGTYSLTLPNDVCFPITATAVGGGGGGAGGGCAFFGGGGGGAGYGLTHYYGTSGETLTIVVGDKGSGGAAGGNPGGTPPPGQDGGPGHDSYVASTNIFVAGYAGDGGRNNGVGGLGGTYLGDSGLNGSNGQTTAGPTGGIGGASGDPNGLGGGGNGADVGCDHAGSDGATGSVIITYFTGCPLTTSDAGSGGTVIGGTSYSIKNRGVPQSMQSNSAKIVIGGYDGP